MYKSLEDEGETANKIEVLRQQIDLAKKEKQAAWLQCSGSAHRQRISLNES